MEKDHCSVDIDGCAVLCSMVYDGKLLSQSTLPLWFVSTSNDCQLCHCNSCGTRDNATAARQFLPQELLGVPQQRLLLDTRLSYGNNFIYRNLDERPPPLSQRKHYVLATATAASVMSNRSSCHLSATSASATTAKYGKSRQPLASTAGGPSLFGPNRLE